MLGLLIVPVLLYCGVAAFLYVAQRQILFRPDVSRPDVAAIGVPGLRATTLRAAGRLDLLAWWLPPPEGRKVVLYFHGNGGNLGDRANRFRSLAAAGFGVLMPEYPGYGGNPGSPSERSLFQTATAALAFLEAQNIAEARIAVYGESLGTGVATWLAADRRFAALILESPFTSITAIAEQQYWFLPVKLLVRDPFDTLSRIGRIQAPLLIALGERDDIVLPRMGRALFAAAPQPKQLWTAPEGGHENLAAFGLLPAVTAFLESTPEMTRPATSSTLPAHGPPGP